MRGRLVTWAAAALLAAAAGPAAARNAADQRYGAAEMARARAALHAGMGGQTGYLAMVDRLEYVTNEGDGLLLWDAQGWLGGDLHKLWVKTEGEHLPGPGRTEEAEAQLLYSRAVSPYFDLQAGLRHDFEPHPTRTHLVLGMQGLAPQWFEIDAAAFVSDEADVTARLEAEYDLFVAQRLVLQPRVELDFSAQDVPRLGIGSGLATAVTGLRLRYEVRREIAPYVGVSWRRAVGDTADYARADGEPVDTFSVVAGLRMWF